jgi:23S rRNA (guanosine2251-2'-O)-methyltransferase
MAQYIYGKNAVKTHLTNQSSCEKLLLLNGFKDKEIIDLIPSDLEVEYLDKDEMDRLTNNGVHQGIIAQVKDYQTIGLNELLKRIEKVVNPILVLLDGIEDPQNFGAIIRTCEATGVSGIIIGEHRSAPLSAVTAKASAGAIEFVKVSKVVNLTRTLQDLKKLGYWIVGTTMDESSVDYRSIDYKSPIVLVIGAEGRGISRLVLENCDFKASIPMFGKINSLNASVATAVMLYQIINSRI